MIVSEADFGHQPSLDERANWRTAVDRAWRSRSLRGSFEREVGLQRQDGAGRSRELPEYQAKFLVWATRRLGLEASAPAEVRAKLSSADHAAAVAIP